MSETSTATDRSHTTWTEKEIRQQPVSWIRSLQQIDRTRDEIAAFLNPLLANDKLKIILTGAGTSAFIGDIIAPWLSRHTGKQFVAVPTTDLVTNPLDYLSPEQPTLLVSFARSGNSPESVAAVELANQLVKSCYHITITCNEGGSLYRSALEDNRSLPLLMPAETHDRGFAMTSSITTMMASCLGVFAPDVINTQSFQDVAHRCAQVIHSQGNFGEIPFGDLPYERVVYLGSGGLQGVAREASLKVLELTAGKLAAFYDTPTGFRHGPKSLVNNKTLAIVLVSSDPYTRQYDLDLLAELRRDGLAMQTIAISASISPEITSGPHILMPAADRTFLDVEQAFCFLMYAQVFALTSSVKAGITPDTPSASGTVNRVVKGVVIHPWKG
ncbi:SIS domain-containing protein [Cedecea sp. NFIX57]|uniref:SIS domain-containing protein n=1 Tax=Cedecea sp. NFIX57 TaxID=1566286 RepID=UPI000A0CFE0A|nr:SIS domain-containing protein [Cedecea sp. NFIX57]SMG50433.1 galactosamine 6-phosphate isomerase AgaS [Cedecea sp. NFIX57]